MGCARVSTSIDKGGRPMAHNTFHVALYVEDLEAAIARYRKILGQEPSKVRHDYAKFEVTDPPVILSLNVGGEPGAGEEVPPSHVAQEERHGVAQRELVRLRERQRRRLAAHPAGGGETADRERAVPGVRQLDEEARSVEEREGGTPCGLEGRERVVLANEDDGGLVDVAREPEPKLRDHRRREGDTRPEPPVRGQDAQRRVAAKGM